MSAEDALMSPSDDVKKLDQVESGEARFEKDKDAVNIEVGQRLIGLTKEQLEQYRNDPFWKTIRMVLFVLFWAAWLLMFAGAILIVVLSPKCAEKQPRKWWETKVSYQILVPTFFDSDGDGVGDLAGITEKLDLLRKIGVTAIYPTPVIQIYKNEFFDPQQVINHEKVDPRFGKEEDLQALIDSAHDKDMFIVLDVPLSSVSVQHEWMLHPAEMVDKQAAFKWKQVKPNEKAQEGFYDAPARGGKKFLGYPNGETPVLNWDEPIVKETILKTIHRLLDMGVDGFNLDHVSRLAVDDNGKPKHDEAIKRLADLTNDIRNYISTNDKLRDKEIVLFSSMHDMEDELHASVTEAGDLHYVIDDSFASLNESNCAAKGGIAQCVHATLSAGLDRKSHEGFIPYWQFSNAKSSRLASRFDGEIANLLTFMQLSLPGAMSLYYGQEMGLKDGVHDSGAQKPQHGVMQWTARGEDHHGFVAGGKKDDFKLLFPETFDAAEVDNFEAQFATENSPLKVSQKLAKMRQRDEVLIVGETEKDELQGDVLVFSRFVRAENSTTDAAGGAYVVALNFGSASASVDFTKLGAGVLPSNKKLEAAEVAAATTGVTEVRAREKVDLAAAPFLLPAKQGILFRL